MIPVPVSNKKKVGMPFVGFGKAIPEEVKDNLGLAPSERLRLLCLRGMPGMDPVVERRLNQELQVIRQLDLSGFFLVLWDIYRFAINAGHVIILNGPASSSLVVHLLGLSPVNPIQHRLFFERFLDPNQTFAPMRQFIICEGGQEEVVRYARAKFGWDNIDKKDLPWHAYSQEWQLPSGGTTDRVAIDIVVHSGLTILNRTVTLIQERHGLDEVPCNLPNNDEKTMDLFRRGDTDDIYQFRSRCEKELLRNLEPKDIDGLAVVLSLKSKARFENRLASDYLGQRNGKTELANLDLRLKEILGETYGILLYQEQIMEIVHRIGGIAKRDGFKLVQAMSKKSLKLIDNFRKKFVTGAKENQIEASIAEKIYDSVVHQGQFTQCKANAINAAIIGYQMAFLKAHHAEAFTAADAEGTYNTFNAAMLAYLKEHHPKAVVDIDAE